MRELNYAQAIREAVDEEMQRDPSVFLFGQDMRALGAQRGNIMSMVVREGAPMVSAGVLAGLVGALALGHALRSMLFGVGAHDPVVFVTVPLVLASVAGVAIVVPALRATSVDPLDALSPE